MSETVKQTLVFYGICAVVAMSSLFGLYRCPFYAAFQIPCGGCGMTRALKSLLHGHVVEAIQYNLLVLPFLVLMGVITSLMAVDIIFQKEYLSALYVRLKQRSFMMLLLVLFMISWIYNLIHYL